MRQFQGLAIIAFLTGFALPMFSRMLLYRGVYIEKDAGYASTVLTLLTFGQFAGVVLWTCLLRYREKTTLLAWSHMLAATGLALDVLIGGGFEKTAIAPIIGVGLAGVFMLPWAILVDVVDLDHWRHRQRREVAMFIVFLILLKGGAAASPVAIGLALDLAGFVAGRPQPAEAQVMIMILAYGAPIVAACASVMLALRMPLTHRKHALLLKRLEY